jgi:hypothetical protein
MRFSKMEQAKEFAVLAARNLRGLASVFKVSLGEFAFAVNEPNMADSGNLEMDLPQLFIALGEAAKAADRGVAILIDEIQYLSEEDLRSSTLLKQRRGIPTSCKSGESTLGWHHKHHPFDSWMQSRPTQVQRQHLTRVSFV